MSESGICDKSVYAFRRPQNYSPVLIDQMKMPYRSSVTFKITLYTFQRIPLSLRIFRNIYLRFLKVVKKHMNKSYIKAMLILKHKIVEKKRSSHYVLFQFAVPKKTQMYKPFPARSWERTHRASSWLVFHISQQLLRLVVLPSYPVFFFFQINIFLQNISSTLLISTFCPILLSLMQEVGCTSTQSSMNEVVKDSHQQTQFLCQQ